MTDIQEKHALMCACSERRLLPRNERVQARVSLEAEGWRITEVPDLCRMAATDPSSLTALTKAPTLLVAACHPRAVYWTLRYSGVERPVTDFLFRDLRPPTGIPATNPAAPSAPPDEGQSWPAWFPVIDYARCTGCRQCVNFCAFGVYAVKDRQVRVVQPRNCKDNCPACARICPTLAIIFPKVDQTPINGADVTEADLVRMRDLAAKADPSAPGNTLHSILAQRRNRPAEPPDEKGLPAS